MFEWFSQTRLLCGDGTVAKAAGTLERIGGTRAVIVTDAGVSSAGPADKVVESLGDKCAGVFKDVPQDTGYEIVDSAYDFAKSKDADVVVSVGGGSVIDTAKALCILMKEGGKAEDHVGLYKLKRRGVPHVVIPTTAGTGSEVTSVAVLLDKKQGKKVYYLSEHIAPEVAILDPSLTVSMPPGLTASTGMDALTHAIEAMVSRLKNPFSAALALEAIKIMRRRLPECVRDGSNLEARAAVQIAATMAGIAFASAQVGMVHAVAHSLGAICGVPHGIANGIMLAPVMRFNSSACAAEMAEVAIALGAERQGRSDEELAAAAADEVEKLLDETNHPKHLSEVNVKPEQISQCAALAVSDTAISTNPRRAKSPEQVEEIIKKVL